MDDTSGGPATEEGDSAERREEEASADGAAVQDTPASPEEDPNTGGDEGEPVVMERSDPPVVADQDIIEMEVDDSNTGDTITSNPEIDLGSAAAAATAVIMEDGDKLNPVIVSTESLIRWEGDSGEGGSSKFGSGRTMEEIVIASKKGAVTPEAESRNFAALTLGDRGDGDGKGAVEEMEVCEESPSKPERVQRTAFDADISGAETDPDNHDQHESDSALDLDHDQAFLHEEESLASLPEDIGETDKENNGADGDLAIEDDDEQEALMEITRRRTSQDTREGNCYCGKDRNLNIAELLCASCCRWFHESCISYQLGKLVPFITNYAFMCKNCSPTGLETFKRSQAQFTQMCVTVLANLTQASVKEGTNTKTFSKDKDIIPFFEMHWEALTTTTRRVTQSWHSTVTKTLQKDSGTVYTCQEVPEDEYSPYFGLLSEDLTHIRPNYEAMIKGGHLRVTDQRNATSSLRGRGAKRRTVGDQSTVVQNTLNKKPRGDIVGPKPVIGHGYPTEHPFNKDSYRYILAEPDPNAPFRQEFDESSEWSGKPIHGWLCRIVNPSSVLLALHDRAPQLKVSEDRLSVTGDKGYCMIRATHGVTRGSWYYEAKITDMPEGSATRIGFSQQFGNLQGPLGFDRYGYSWRSRYGTAFHEAKGKSFAKGGYGLDDVLGFLIVLPEVKEVPLVSTSFKDRPLVKVKSHLYYEDKDDSKELLRRDTRPHSKIICFKNGVYQGVAFDDIYCGTYYPAISLYKSITVKVNFGPDFWAPPADHEYRGMCERAESSIIEQTMADLLYLTENDGRLRLENAVPLPL